MRISNIKSIGSRNVLIISILVIILMIGSLLAVPWFFGTAYETNTNAERHSVAHESTAAFNQTVTEHSISTANPTPVTELSDPAQTIFRETKTQDRDRSGWQSYTAIICQPEMPVCDENRQPTDFNYGDALDATELYDVIEDEDGIYLVKTGYETYVDRGTFPSSSDLLIWLVFLPMAVSIGFLIKFKRETHPEMVLGLAVFGLFLTIFGIIKPFLEMFFGLTIFDNFLVIITVAVLTWITLFLLLNSTVNDPDAI